ncbi:hypothetical protein ACOMHN_030954 [Nucella lapillus]
MYEGVTLQVSPVYPDPMYEGVTLQVSPVYPDPVYEGVTLQVSAVYPDPMYEGVTLQVSPIYPDPMYEGVTSQVSAVYPDPVYEGVTLQVSAVYPDPVYEGVTLQVSPVYPEPMYEGVTLQVSAVYPQVIDTPGLFDTNMDDAHVSKEILHAVGCLSPGPHAILLVVRADTKFTKEDADVMTYLCEWLGQDMMHHVIIVFTHGDVFKNYDEFFTQCKVDNHFVLFNNNETQEERAQEQVKQLMLAVNDNLKRTNRRPFEHEIFRRCHQTIMTNAKELVRKMGGSLTMESARLLLLDTMTGNNVTHQVLQDILDRGADDSKKIKDLEAEKDHLATRVEQANINIAELKANDDDKAEKLGKALREKAEHVTKANEAEIAIAELKQELKKKDELFAQVAEQAVSFKAELLNELPNDPVNNKPKIRCTLL